MHIHRYVVINAADGVYQLNEGLEIHCRVYVGRKTEDVGNALKEPDVYKRQGFILQSSRPIEANSPLTAAILQLTVDGA